MKTNHAKTVVVRCDKPVTGGYFVAGKRGQDSLLVADKIYDIVFVGGDEIPQDMCPHLLEEVRWCHDDDEFIIKLPCGKYRYLNITSDIEDDGGELYEDKK